MTELHALAEKARPYLPDLPPTELLSLHGEEVWEGVDPRVQGFVRNHIPGDFRVAIRPGLPPEERERVILHELIHLAAPDLKEPWVRIMENILVYALERGLPPRDIASLADLSLEEAMARLDPPREVPEGFRALAGNSPYLPLYLALGVLPQAELASVPIYFLEQVAAGLPHTGWALERLWPEPPLTKREASRRMRRRLAGMGEEEWHRLLTLLHGDGELLGDFLTPIEVPGWPLLPPKRGNLYLSLRDALHEYSPPGEAYEPPEAGDPWAVVAGLLATGRELPD